MTGTVSGYNQIQKIPQIQVANNFLFAAGSGATNQDIYTCPAGKKALFTPFIWVIESSPAVGSSMELHLKLVSGTDIIIDSPFLVGGVFQNTPRLIQNIILLAGDKLYFHVNNVAVAPNDTILGVSSAPLELST